VWCKFAEVLIAAAAAAAVAWGVRSGGTFAGLPAGLWLLLATVIVIGCQLAVLPTLHRRTQSLMVQSSANQGFLVEIFRAATLLKTTDATAQAWQEVVL
jgi:ABC-type arginine/histidine transport system permease subunit